MCSGIDAVNERTGKPRETGSQVVLRRADYARAQCVVPAAGQD